MTWSIHRAGWVNGGACGASKCTDDETTCAGRGLVC